MFKTLPWTPIYNAPFAVADTRTDDPVAAVLLPQGLIFPTFAIETIGIIAGTVAAKLRFVFVDAEAAPAGQGIDFPVLAVGLSVETRSPVWGGTTAAPLAHPDYTGNNNAILPPRVVVLLSTVAFAGTVQISYSGIMLP